MMNIQNILKKLNQRNTFLIPKFSKIQKNVLSVFLVLFLVLFVKNILANDDQTILKDTLDAQKTKNNSESWQQNAWNTTSVNALTTLTGKDFEFNSDGSVKTTGYVPGGMIGNANAMIASMYKPQASGIEYIAQVKNNFLGKQSYAQGVSFDQTQKNLEPLLPAWKGFRNIVYGLFSIVFVIIGIMIMLRIKISPQAVISIQNAIPKLVTALIMVTFSYAIAGLVIDISYFIQSMVISFFFDIKGKGLGNELFDFSYFKSTVQKLNLENLNNANFNTLSQIAQGSVPTGSLFALVANIMSIITGNILGGLLSVLGGNGGMVGRWVGNVVGGVILGGIGGVLMLVILLFLVSFWLIKLWFGLLSAYVVILIQVITAPFVIAMGAFPNSKVGFNSWLLQLVSKVAVFPVVLIATIFINYLGEISSGCKLWIPSLLTTGSTSFCEGELVGAAVGLAGLAMLSKLPKLVPEAIFKLKPSGFGKAIGENIMPVVVGAGKKAKSGAANSLNAADVKWGDQRGNLREKALFYSNRLMKGRDASKKTRNDATSSYNNPGSGGP